MRTATAAVAFALVAALGCAHFDKPDLEQYATRHEVGEVAGQVVALEGQVSEAKSQAVHLAAEFARVESDLSAAIAGLEALGGEAGDAVSEIRATLERVRRALSLAEEVEAFD